MKVCDQNPYQELLVRYQELLEYTLKLQAMVAACHQPAHYIIQELDLKGPHSEQYKRIQVNFLENVMSIPAKKLLN